jgi:hypothetical protein
MYCVEPSVKRGGNEGGKTFNAAVHDVLGVNKGGSHIIDSFAVFT